MEFIRSFKRTTTTTTTATTASLTSVNSELVAEETTNESDHFETLTNEQQGCHELAIKLHESFPESYDWMTGSFERDWMCRMLRYKKGVISKAYQAITESISLMDTLCITVKNRHYPPIPVQGYEFLQSKGETDLIDYPPFREIRKYVSWSFHKYSKTYAPIFIVRTGHSELRRLQEHVAVERCYEIMICMYDYMDRYGKRDYTMVLILDYSDMERRYSSIQSLWFLKSIYMFHERHFPGRFEKIFVTNVSGAFYTFWKWMKPWLSSSIIDRVYLLNSAELHVLHQFVAKENLPSFLEGTCETCSSSMGCVPLPS